MHVGHMEAERVTVGHGDDIDAAQRRELHLPPGAHVYFQEAEGAVARVQLELGVEGTAVAQRAQESMQILGRP
jgi:hypothetical protein